MNNELEQIVKSALNEDIGSGDLSANLLRNKTISAEVICRDKAIICGCEYFDLCFSSLDSNIRIDWKVKDGSNVSPGEIICTINGNSQAIITAERTALNFLQLLSAVATKTSFLIKQISNTNAKLLDTRKTIPGLRKAQKYAVKCGGGLNHRMGLYDCVMLKENHILAFGSLEKCLKKATSQYPNKPIIIEVETLEQLQTALSVNGIMRILCDNFSITELSQAVKLSRGVYPLEASGGINENNIVDYAETGVDYISIGSITKDINSIDLSLNFTF
mgnify:FL=1